MIEKPVVIPHDGQKMIGIIHQPETNPKPKGVVILVGGPQNRWGSHRQFLLLARELCSQGYPVLRFDYCGMGDSEGNKTEFLEASPNLKTAMDFFVGECRVDDVVIWGLCDAVSLSLMYMSTTGDQRVSDIVALNPWVRQSQTEAKVMLKRYYLRRLTSPAFWKKLLTFNFSFMSSLVDLLKSVKQALIKSPESGSTGMRSSGNRTWPVFTEGNYIDAMKTGLATFAGAFHLVLSGNDLTADEFRELVRKDEEWADLIARKCTNRLELSEANHTFSTQEWRQAVEAFTLSCLSSQC